METVGIRELKAHLSRYLKRVRAGRQLMVTERGRTIAAITPMGPAEESTEVAWAHQLVRDGRADWSGDKPKGAGRQVALQAGPPISDTVLEDRR